MLTNAWIFIYSKQLLMKQWLIHFWVWFHAQMTLSRNGYYTHTTQLSELCGVSRAHPIFCWLPSKLAVWLAENLGQELLVPAKLGDKGTVPVEESNMMIFNDYDLVEQPGHFWP